MRGWELGWVRKEKAIGKGSGWNSKKMSMKEIYC